MKFRECSGQINFVTFGGVELQKTLRYVYYLNIIIVYQRKSWKLVIIDMHSNVEQCWVLVWLNWPMYTCIFYFFNFFPRIFWRVEICLVDELLICSGKVCRRGEYSLLDMQFLWNLPHKKTWVLVQPYSLYTRFRIYISI